MDLRKQILRSAKNSVWLILEKSVRAIIGLLVGLWVIRYLGPEQFGFLSYALVFLSLFQTFASLGLDAVVVRKIAYEKSRYFKFSDHTIDRNSELNFKNEGYEESSLIGEILGTVFILRIISGTICFLLSLLLIVIIKGWNSEVLLIFVLAGAGLIFQSMDTVDLWFQSEVQGRRTVIVKIFSYVLSNLLRVIFIILGLSVVWFSLAIFLEAALIAFLLYQSYKRYPCSETWSNKFRPLGYDLLKQSWPILLSGVAGSLYTKFDQLMIAQQLGEKQMGIYTAMTFYVISCYFLPGVICTSLMPTLTKCKEYSYPKYISILRYLYLFNTTIGMCIFIIFYIYSETIIKITLGESYLSGNHALIIYSITVIPVFIGVINSLWLVIEKKTVIIFYRSLAGATASILLCLYLIPKMEIVGAAIATVLALIIADIFIPFLLNYKFLLNLINYKKIYK